MIPKSIDRGRTRTQLLQFIQVLVFLALHLDFITVLKTLTPLVTHVAYGELLVGQRANALLLLLEIHLALKLGLLFNLLVVLVNLRRHLVIVRLLLL